MMKVFEIFWVEEETDDSLAEMKGVIESSLEFMLEVAENCNEAKEKIKKKCIYDLIIIDIRIPLGSVNLNSLSSQNAHNNQYGIDVIRFISEEFNLLIDKVLVFTNESWSDISIKLIPFGIKYENYIQKKDIRSNKHFEELLKKKLSRNE